MTTPTKLRRDTAVEPNPFATVEPYRFTINQYYAMAEAGILTADDRVELIDGVIIAMAPMAGPHIGGINRFTRILPVAVGQRAIVQVQCPVRLDDGTEPLPDVALLKERADFYDSGPAGPADVLLLIEVADSSADYDRYEKLPRYARAGIPEVWIAVLPERMVEVHTEPTGDGYAATRRLRAEAVLTPGCFPDIKIPVDTIIPG